MTQNVVSKLIMWSAWLFAAVLAVLMAHPSLPPSNGAAAG